MGYSNRHIGILAYCLIGLLFFSCSKEGEREPEVTTGRTIRRELTLQTIGMQRAGGGSGTRATTTVPLTADEAGIHNLCVLQFGGTEGTSTLIKKGEVPASDIHSDTGVFSFDFEELADGTQSAVYVLANIPSSALDGFAVNSTTLAAFEASSLPVTPLTEAAMKASGLPMVASQSFDYATENPAFVLKSVLAKVVFKYVAVNGYTFANANLSARHLASAVPFKEPAAGASVQHPSGIDYKGELTLVGDGTYGGAETVCYLPENLSGQVAAITKDSDRGGEGMPQEGTYIHMEDSKLTMTSCIYRFYLGNGMPQDFNLQRHCRYTFNLRLWGKDTADKRVTFKTANCYLVDALKSNVTYSFLATVMGNGAVTPEIVPAPLHPVDAKVLWEQSDPTGASNAAGDVIQAGSVSVLNGTFIQFTTGTKPGNAVIGAFDKNGNLIWSWHIWRPESTLSTVACHTTANGGRDFYMMDRNLGAFNNNVNDVKAYGLLYQWGRKDPFPNATGVKATDSGSATFNGVIEENGYSFAAVETATGITVQGSVQTPMSFYYKITSPNDWMSTKNDNLWGNPCTDGSTSPNPDLGSKSIYDPCPPGYRVPPQDTWSQATASNSTWDTNGQQLGVGTGATPAKYFYPAAGLRWGDSDKGKLSNVGALGYYWSSSPYSYGGTSAGHLYFGSGLVDPENSYSRAYGMSVRCAKE